MCGGFFQGRHPLPKRQRAGALHNASRGPRTADKRASVLECGGPPPLFPRAPRDTRSAKPLDSKPEYDPSAGLFAFKVLANHPALPLCLRVFPIG